MGRSTASSRVSTHLDAGGTFKTHGMLYDNTWGRELYAPGDSNCTGPSGYQVSTPLAWHTSVVKLSMQCCLG